MTDGDGSEYIFAAAVVIPLVFIVILVVLNSTPLPFGQSHEAYLEEVQAQHHLSDDEISQLRVAGQQSSTSLSQPLMYGGIVVLGIVIIISGKAMGY